MTPLYPWFVVAPQVAQAEGFEQHVQDQLATAINRAIRVGELLCWHPDGTPFVKLDSIPMLASQENLIRIPHLTEDGLNHWLEERRYLVKWTPITPPLDGRRLPLPQGSAKWVSAAQSRAREIIKNQKAKDLYPNQVDIADQISKEFRVAGPFGSDGKPLAGATIKRHALEGITSAQGKQQSTMISRGK